MAEALKKGRQAYLLGLALESLPMGIRTQRPAGYESIPGRASLVSQTNNYAEEFNQDIWEELGQRLQMKIADFQRYFTLTKSLGTNNYSRVRKMNALTSANKNVRKRLDRFEMRLNRVQRMTHFRRPGKHRRLPE